MNVYIPKALTPCIYNGMKLSCIIIPERYIDIVDTRF